MQRDRRQFLRLGGLAAVGAVAGCSSDANGNGGNGNGNGNGNGGTGGTTATTTTRTATTTESGGDSGGSASFDGWLADTSNFDGSVVDERGSSEVTIDVGSSANDGAFGFAPPAVRVDPGTTLVWEWTGDGGAHNVVGETVDFRSGDATSDAGTTFETSFDGDVTVAYYCNPHRAMGMKGVVVVGEGGEPDGGGGGGQYGWQAATFDAYWYSLYNMSTNIAMSANGVLFPHNDQQQQAFEQRFPAIAGAADVEKPPIRNPNLNMAPFTRGDPQFTQQPVFDAGDGRPDASTLQWDMSKSSKVVSPSSAAWTHLKGVTWAKNFQGHFDILPGNIAPKFRSQVLTTLAQIGTNATLIAGGPEGNGALTKGESLELVSEFRPGDGTVVDDTTRPHHHGAMLWFLSDLVSLAQGGWFGYVNPEPLIPAGKIQQLADGMAKTTMNALSPADVVSMESTRSLGLLLGAVGYYGTQAGSSDLESQAVDYANALADELAGHAEGNGRIADGAPNQAATQGIVGQGLLWAGELDGFDRSGLADDALGYMHDELWDADARTYASGVDDDVYTITARDAGDVTGGINADDAILGRSGVRERFAAYFDATFNEGGLQRAQRPQSVDGETPTPPLPPAAGGEFGQAAVYNAEIEYDTGAGEWAVTDDGFDTAGALYLANQDVWIGRWAGDPYQGRGIPGRSDTPPGA